MGREGLRVTPSRFARIVDMKKTLVSLTLFVLVFVFAVALRQPSKAQTSAATPKEGKGCAVPKEWGQLRGVSDRVIAFEDSLGTIRVLDVGPCMRGQTQLVVRIDRPQ
jgi:hypothetical protein